MLRSFAFTAAETLLETLAPSSAYHPTSPGILLPGKTTDVPFSPLEEMSDVRVKAAQPNATEVDLSQWAEEEDTLQRSQAKVVLR